MGVRCVGFFSLFLSPDDAQIAELFLLAGIGWRWIERKRRRACGTARRQSLRAIFRIAPSREEIFLMSLKSLFGCKKLRLITLVAARDERVAVTQFFQTQV